MPQHAVAKIAGPPQAGHHLGGRFHSALSRLNSSEQRFTRGLAACIFFECPHEWIKSIEHRPVAGLRAPEFADCPAALLERLGPLLNRGSPGAFEDRAAAEQKHSIERPGRSA